MAKARKAPKPKDVALPGMAEARGEIASLERLCGQIAEIRTDLNALRADESETLQSALLEMRKNDRVTYRAHGVELARVPGEEKLRVRTTKQKASAETSEPDREDEDSE